MKTLLLFLILIVFLTKDIMSQNAPEFTKGTRSLSFQLFGPEVLGAYYNRYLSKNLSWNAGVGMGFNSHVGFNYYPFKVSRLSLYTGGQVCLLTEVDISSLFNIYGSQIGGYIPIGLQFTGPKGFTLHLEGGPNFFREDYSQRNTQSFLYTVRIGKTWFKQK